MKKILCILCAAFVMFGCENEVSPGKSSALPPAETESGCGCEEPKSGGDAENTKPAEKQPETKPSEPAAAPDKQPQEEQAEPDEQQEEEPVEADEQQEEELVETDEQQEEEQAETDGQQEEELEAASAEFTGSIEEAAAWLAVQPENTADNLYTVKINSGLLADAEFEKLIAPKRFISLDLYGMTGEFGEGQRFPRNKNDSKKNKYLVKLVIPEGVTTISESMFQSQQGLRSIVLPSTLEKIDKAAFGWCSHLDSLIINANIPPKVMKLSFTGVAESFTVSVPSCSVDDYQNHSVWKNWTIKELVE